MFYNAANLKVTVMEAKKPTKLNTRREFSIPEARAHG